MASEKTPASIPNSGWCQVCGSALNVSREPNVESKVGVPPACPAAGAVGRTLELPGPTYTIWSQNQLLANGKVASLSAPSFLWAPAPGPCLVLSSLLTTLLRRLN